MATTTNKTTTNKTTNKTNNIDDLSNIIFNLTDKHYIELMNSLGNMKRNFIKVYYVELTIENFKINDNLAINAIDKIKTKILKMYKKEEEDIENSYYEDFINNYWEISRKLNDNDEPLVFGNGNGRYNNLKRIIIYKWDWL